MQQENERLILEQCLMTMIFNVDLLCRVRMNRTEETREQFLLIQVPSALCDELQLPSARTTKKLDELVRNECNGEFQLKKYIFKKTEQFLQVIPFPIECIHLSSIIILEIIQY